MKARVNISIDVTKIDKERIKMGKKRPDGSYGKYISLTTFVDTEKKASLAIMVLLQSKLAKRKEKLAYREIY